MVLSVGFGFVFLPLFSLPCLSYLSSAMCSGRLCLPGHLYVFCVFCDLLQGGGKEQYITTLIVLLLPYKEVKTVGGLGVVHTVIETETYALNHSCY